MKPSCQGILSLVLICACALAAAPAALAAGWTAETSGPATSLYALDFVDTQHGWAVGSGGVIAATANGGATWSSQPSGTVTDLAGVNFVDAQHGWAAGAGIILATTDGGATWIKQSGGGVWQYLDFLDVAVTSPKTVWLAGQWALIGSTVNSGATWSGQIVGEQILGGISFVGNQHGWTVGNLGVISATWAPQSSARVLPAPNRNGWNRTPVTVDYPSTTMAGYSVTGVEYRLGDGPWLPAAKDGAGWKTTVTRNGVTDVGYRGTDSAGNVEDPQSVMVRMDTKKPVPKALAKAAVKKGRKATLRYRVNDVCPACAVAISIRNARGKRVKQLKVPAAPTNVNAKVTFTCKLKKGSYTWKVSATDLAGNKQPKAASSKLTVK